MTNENLNAKIKSIDEQILELQQQKDQLRSLQETGLVKDDFINVSALLRDTNISIQNILISHGYTEDELFEVHLNNHAKLVRCNAFLSLKLVANDGSVIYKHSNYADDLNKWLEAITDRSPLIASIIERFGSRVKNENHYFDRFIVKSRSGLDLKTDLTLSESSTEHLDIEIYHDLSQNSQVMASGVIPLGGNFAIDITDCESEVCLFYKDSNLTIDEVSAAIDDMAKRIEAFNID